ncbi:hypothetical protein MMC13_003435 [Lambiella insularis]|nr:hypothetical protein [Lambiella insularis]
MSSPDTNLAASALAIALVALLTAVGQLLQQYLATADGYRRCQKSVMGDWATKTRLRWRWREFRFETLYTTPEVFITGDGAPRKANHVLITGTKTSRKLTYVPGASIQSSELMRNLQKAHSWFPFLPRLKSWYSHDERVKKETQEKAVPREIVSDDLVCWLPLLEWIHTTTYESLNYSNFLNTAGTEGYSKRRIPALILRERSWDFQRPDVVRPLAKTTISDIAVIARRMGMRWKDFRPADGVLRAEGHSHIITSTVVRSLGIVLQYSYTGQGARLELARMNMGFPIAGSINMERTEIYIPTARCDRLGAGVIRGDVTIGVRDFTIGTQQEIIVTLRKLDKSGLSAAVLTEILKQNPGFQLRVADIVAMTLDMVRIRGSGLVQVPAPSDNVLGVTTSPLGRRAFRDCLGEYLEQMRHAGKEAGLQTYVVMNMCDELSRAYPEWDHSGPETQEDEHWVVTRNIDFLERVHDSFDSMTRFLSEIELPYSHRYVNLLGLHIRLAVFCPEGETTPLHAQVPTYDSDVARYFDRLPAIIAAAQEERGWSEEFVVDAWTTMMLRAFCWGASHFLVPGERVPIAYYGSLLPVYIG